MALTKFYKIVQADHEAVQQSGNQDIGNGTYGNYTWYHKLVQGSANRLVKYKEYDIMDNDIDVARSLDIIAEEMTGNNPKGKQPLLIQLIDEPDMQIKSKTVVTLKAALRTWCKIQEWHKRMFELSRHVVKYGDCFFLRPKTANKKYSFVHAKHVVSAAVSEDDITDVKGWYIKTDYRRADGGSANYNVGGGLTSVGEESSVQHFDASDVIRFSLNDDMSDEAPFGVSIMRPVYITFKQKELLEDAILIYRIQRAPERRVFYIDIGRMPPHKVSAHLNQIKNEIKQKKIPSQFGGKSQVDSIYNPQSMQEDFFLPQRQDGSGSKIETLPGGQGLGELTDLEYFYKKLWRAMRIPQSYMSNTMEDGGIDNSGKVGIAYMQEIKFTLYIQRLQSHVERVMDEEFKKYLYSLGVNIDPTIYEVVLPEPSDYSSSRDQAKNADLLSSYGTAEGAEALSGRFALKKYLQLSPDEIKENERLKAEELGLDMNADNFNLAKIYNPEAAELGDFDGGGGLGAGGDIGGAGTGAGGDIADSDTPDGGDSTGGDTASGDTGIDGQPPTPPSPPVK